MAASVARCGRLFGRLRPWSLAALTIAAVVFAAELPARAADAVPPGEPVIVVLDQAKVLKLPERTTTLVVGNPLIADVSVQAGGLLVVTGKSYGVTNLVALDRNGGLLMEHPIQVQGPYDKVVQVYRGTERESYSCTPACERRITLGDSQVYFTNLLGQSNAVSTMAGGSQQPAR